MYEDPSHSLATRVLVRVMPCVPELSLHTAGVMPKDILGTVGAMTATIIDAGHTANKAREHGCWLVAHTYNLREGNL